MFLRVAQGLIAYCLLTCASWAGVFDDHLGTYSGKYVERGLGTYRARQTSKVRASAITTVTTIAGFRVVEVIRYNKNHTLSGTGSGGGISWTVTGNWRRTSNGIRGYANTFFHHDGSMSAASFVFRFKDGKLVTGAYGYDSDGAFYSSKGVLEFHEESVAP